LHNICPLSSLVLPPSLPRARWVPSPLVISHFFLMLIL